MWWRGWCYCLSEVKVWSGAVSRYRNGLAYRPFLSVLPQWGGSVMKLILPVIVLAIIVAYPVMAETSKYSPDINRDGGYSIVESILSQQKLFRDMDADQNGQLTLEESRTFIDKMKAKKSAWDIQNSFGYMDVNDDKSLSELEFLEGVENEFRMKDRNRDNMITTDEMPM